MPFEIAIHLKNQIQIHNNFEQHVLQMSILAMWLIGLIAFVQPKFQAFCGCCGCFVKRMVHHAIFAR